MRVTASSAARTIRRMKVPTDQEPEQVVADAAKETVKRAWTRLTDTARNWLTLKLLGLVVSGVAAAAAAIVSLPWFAAFACTVVTLVAVAFGIAARRLMHVERERRHWQEIGLLRSEQATLK